MVTELDLSRSSPYHSGPWLCFDCQFRLMQEAKERGKDGFLPPRQMLGRVLDEEPIPLEPHKKYVCEHWRPEYWEARGYKRDWGDAAVMNWPFFEVLRKGPCEKDKGESAKYVILSVNLRRPLRLDGDWGSY